MLNQDAKITFGAYAVGGDTGRAIHGPVRVEEGFEGGTITFNVAISEAVEADFTTLDQAIRDAFSKRRVRVLFELGSETRVDWDPAGTGDNYAFDQMAVARKVGTEGGDTERSTIYEVTITASFAPEDSATGQADSTTTIEYAPSRQRTVTFRGKWTSIPGTTSARANYLAGIAAFTASKLTAIDASATFERIRESVDINDSDRSAEFISVHREKFNTQDGISKDAVGIVEDSITWRDVTSSPGDSGAEIKRLREIQLDYACEVDITVTLDLENLYQNTLRDFLIDQFVSKYSPTSYAIVHEIVLPNNSFNTLGVSISFQAVIDGSDVIQSNVTSRIVENSGITLTGAWTGSIFDKYADQGIAIRRRFTIRATEVLGEINPEERVGGGGTKTGIDGNPLGPGGGLQPSGGSGPTKSGWQLIDNDSAATVLTRGQPDGEQFATTLLIETVVEEWITAPSGGREFGLSLGAEGSTTGISL